MDELQLFSTNPPEPTPASKEAAAAQVTGNEPVGQPAPRESVVHPLRRNVKGVVFADVVQELAAPSQCLPK